MATGGKGIVGLPVFVSYDQQCVIGLALGRCLSQHCELQIQQRGSLEIGVTTYVAICDESDWHQGNTFCRFFGGLLLSQQDYWVLTHQLGEALASRLGVREFKSTSVDSLITPAALELVDMFYDFVDSGQVKVRIVFSRKNHVFRAGVIGTRAYYFDMYRHFIKHGFGFQHAPAPDEGKHRLLLHLDTLPEGLEPTCQFRNTLISNFEGGRNGPWTLFPNDIREVDSKREPLLQYLDVVLGCLRSHMDVPIQPGMPVSKRRRAREAVALRILERIRRHAPGFDPKYSTISYTETHRNWSGKHNHWLFRPR